ncbi:MAG TPA: M12 family metallopeptidase [Oligoflexus sp.]|uniref:M12 family metallopeptidase n=1 Tax=Oligoflexus sp. TaxID=1971216 RepID=UPI002D258ED1|nr:M12 family metallopeptidase [Oligoflexus sp.]HYX33447.1 M12 family metallopeptidase [Oligoflexus sp.]
MKQLMLIGLTLLMASCGSSQSDLHSVADASATWSNPSAIPVCFVDGNANWQKYRDSVKQTITSNYNQTESVRFTGWGICGSTSKKSTIRIKMGNPISFSEGSVMGCSHIGPGPSSFSACESLLSDYSGSGFNMYIFPLDQGTVVHEFGHALGLRHEHARSDAPARCQTRELARNGGNVVYLSEDYDYDSVMGYCNNASELSATDIDGLNQLYP